MFPDLIKSMRETSGAAPSVPQASWITSIDELWYPKFPSDKVAASNLPLSFLYEPYWPIAGAIFYLISKPLLKKFVSAVGVDPKAKWLKALVVVHSLALCIYSGLTVYYAWGAVFQTLAQDGLYATYCNSNNALWNNGMDVWGTLFYASKYYEFIDTWVLVVKQKPVSFLQTYHHAGAVITMWGLTVTQAPGVVWFVCLNSIIHTVMYAYYAAAALGYRWSGKKYLTTCQIVQFFTGIFGVFSVHLLGPECANEAQQFTIAICEAYAVVLIFLFAAFFRQSYLSKKVKKAN
jgi:hypothetical protein|mmetsp:Transcript_19724/g.28514  ORF Transcript_19724/g.28514 Transcript_19724/m.28514 type:complete len:291 (-) Transcript_19724:275-1147(-)